jgi:hypothetical protein
MFDVHFISIDSWAYGVESLKIRLGESVELNAKVNRPVSWFTNNDQVLQVKEMTSGEGFSKAEISCSSQGRSTILLLDNDLNRVGKIELEVTSSEAAFLEITTSVEPK